MWGRGGYIHEEGRGSITGCFGRLVDEVHCLLLESVSEVVQSIIITMMFQLPIVRHVIVVVATGSYMYVHARSMHVHKMIAFVSMYVCAHAYLLPWRVYHRVHPGGICDTFFPESFTA